MIKKTSSVFKVKFHIVVPQLEMLSIEVKSTNSFLQESSSFLQEEDSISKMTTIKRYLEVFISILFILIT